MTGAQIERELEDTLKVINEQITTANRVDNEELLASLLNAKATTLQALAFLRRA